MVKERIKFSLSAHLEMKREQFGNVYTDVRMQRVKEWNLFSEHEQRLRKEVKDVILLR